MTKPGTESTSPPATPMAPTLLSEQIAEMRRIDNSSNPSILPVGKVTASWSGHILDKDDGKWLDWSYSMELELSLTQLWECVFNAPDLPHPTYEPRANRAWISNNRLACAFIKRALSPSEQKLCADEWDPVALWAYLKDRHGGAVPVQQVRLLQEALTTKCLPSESLTKTMDSIIEKIDRAFDAGAVTKELIQLIAILSALSDRSYAHIQSIISRDLTAAGDVTKYGLKEIRRFLEGEQTLINADKANPVDVVLAATPTAKNSKYAKLVCEGCKLRGRSNFTGHTLPWCILDGGGMAGKTVEESRAARIAHFKAKEKDKKKASSKVTITPSGGSAFTLEGDPDFVAAYIAARETATTPTAKAEFVGLMSDALPTATFVEVEEMEFDAWVVLEEELEPGTCGQHDRGNETVLTSVSLNTLPFYLDSGATVHITPNPSDFTSLTPIPERPIRGVGGSTIVATAIGKICLHTKNGSILELDDVLLVPKSTVRLLSISKLAKRTDIETIFDESGAKLVHKTTKEIIATGTLLPNKNLYAIDLYLDHVLTIHASADIETWHKRLGHANYQAIMQMARAGMVEGMPRTFHTKPPKCDHCILGKQARTPVPKKREEGEGHKAMRRLGKIWVDLSGKAAVASRTGNYYIMNIVDDFTNKPWSIPLKNKDDGFGEL